MSDDDRDNDIESDADKRAHHNALERKRRDHIKDSFSMLRDSLPFFQGDKVRASRAQILKKAADYIQSMRRKNTAHQQDIDDLKKQNRHLEDQIHLIEKLKRQGKYREAFELVRKAWDSISSYKESSKDSEDKEDVQSELPQKKKVKLNVESEFPQKKRVKLNVESELPQKKRVKLK